MAKSKQRRVIVFIVEGPSDEIVINGTLGKLFKSKDIVTECFVYPIGGDITSDYESATNTIKGVVGNRVKEFISFNKLLPSDIKHIIQITDTDGAFIPNERVLQMSDDEYDECKEAKLYLDDCIHAYTVSDIISRNMRKSRNLNVLTRCPDIKLKEGDTAISVPYSIYYFSCNLDHYLHNERNLPHIMKREKAWDYIDKCDDNPTEFFETICNPACSAQNVTYMESWNYIKQECRSLSRYNNLSLLLNTYKNE